MPPTILVTGASGALGRHLIPEIQQAGYQVRGHYCSRRGSVEGVDWQRMNFLETLDFSALVAECDAVIHLAAETNSTSLMYRVNVEATAALMAAAQSAGARYFGYASSIVVYGSPRRRVIDETTPLLDPWAPLVWQYRADQSMLEYARTKVLAERSITESRPRLNVDIYRPTLVADLDRILEAGHWSTFRKLAFSYRQTQYIYVRDAVAAILHLMVRGLRSPMPQSNVEAFNFADEDCGTYRDILSTAYKTTGDRRYKVSINLPISMMLDLSKDALKYRQLTLRYSLGMLRIRNAKLLQTGFRFPFGIKSALGQALTRRISHSDL
jgi:nucleoside-diphosphate-sugar epimerase